MITDIINVVDTLSEAKDVEREVIFEAIENALESTTKKKYTENMDVKELRDFYINALHEDIQEAYDDQGQKGAFEEMESWDSETFDDIKSEYNSIPRGYI